ncbi:MAG: BON domain-containing protein [Kofleriaceae bacterium]
MQAHVGMANQNGQHHGGSEIEHGYQDWRDQRDQERGRDDFHGFARHHTGEPGERYRAAGSGSQANGEHDYDRDRDWVSSPRYDYDSRYDDGRRVYSGARGQSGAQAGSRDHREEHTMGSSGHWGDFDRGGQSGGRDHGYDTQAARFGRESERTYGRRDEGEAPWGVHPTWSPDRDMGVRGPHGGKGPQGFQRSDERILERVHEALTDHEHIDATDVTVEVKDGEVVLTGTVEDRKSKRLAEDIAERVSGVKDVQNQLRLHPPGQAMPAASAPESSHLTASARKSSKPS